MTEGQKTMTDRLTEEERDHVIAAQTRPDGMVIASRVIELAAALSTERTAREEAERDRDNYRDLAKVMEDKVNDLIATARDETEPRLRAAEKRIARFDEIIRTAGGDHLSHMEVAGMVRMLTRSDLNHEAVCCIARDRITILADRLGASEERVKSLTAALEAIADSTSQVPGVLRGLARMALTAPDKGETM